MEFTINKKQLLAALVAGSKILNQRAAIQILQNFHILVKGGSVFVTASDQDNVISTGVKTESSDGEGAFCIESRRFITLLKNITDTTVRFNVDEGSSKVSIISAGGRYSFAILPGNDFPMPPRLDDEDAVNFTVASSVVEAGLDSTSFAADDQNVRPILGGVYWEVRPESLTMVATNTYMLSRFRSTLSAPGVETSFVLSIKGTAMLKDMTSRECALKISVHNGSAVFRTDNAVLRTTLLAGRFPDYRRVIPESSPSVCTVSRVGIENAVKRVSLCSPESSLLQLGFSSGNLSIDARSTAMGSEGSEKVECSYNGDDMTVGLSATYLSTMLSRLSTDKVFVKLASPQRPVVILPGENAEGAELTLLCMPMAIPSEQ